MKTTIYHLGGVVAVLCAGVTAAGPAAASVIVPDQPQLVAADNYTETIVGIVTRTTDEYLTVEYDTVIRTPATATYTKEGKPSMLSDIEVGDRVQVTAFRDPSTGALRAESVDVTVPAHGDY